MCLETPSVSGTRFGLSVQHDAWEKILVSKSTIGKATLERPIEVDVLARGGGSAAGAFLPVEHDPLGAGSNAIMALIEGRETSQDCIIIVGHVVDRFCITACRDTRSVGFRSCKAMPRIQIPGAWPNHAGDVFFSEICPANCLITQFRWVDVLF